MHILKSKKPFVVLLIIFIISSCIRGVLALKTGVVSIVYDELIYWDISKSIYANASTLFRGLPVASKDIFYPLIIAWTHRFGDFLVVHNTMMVVNAILMSSVVFPAYKLANLILKNESTSIFIASVSVLVPEMVYSTRLIQENLYYPLMMCGFYLFVKYIINDKYNFRKLVAVSFYICILSHVKMIGWCVLAAFLLFYFVYMILEKSKDSFLYGILSCMEVLTLCIVFRYIFDSIINRLLVQGAGDAVASLTGTGIKAFFDFQRIIGYIYPVISYIVFISLFFGVFTLIIPIAYFKLLQKREQDFLIFCIALGMATLGVVCLLVMGADNELGQRVTRIHLRYLYYLFIPILILFMKSYELIKKQGINQRCIWISVIYILLVLVTVPKIAPGSAIDAVPGNSLIAFFLSDSRQQILKGIIIMGVILGNILLLLKKEKALYIMTFVMLLSLTIHSSQKTYLGSYNERIVLSSIQTDGNLINQFFEDKKIKSLDEILLVGQGKASTCVMEVYLEIPYRVCQRDELIVNAEQNSGKIHYSELPFYQSSEYKVKSNNIPTYIISQGDIEIAGYEKENIGLQNFSLYSYK